MGFALSWQDQLPLIEFAYNSYHCSIDMAPFEKFYGRRFCTPLFWDEVGERQVEGPEMVQWIVNKVDLIKRRIKIAQDRQASYANIHRMSLHYEPGEYIFLRVSPFRKCIADDSHIIHPTDVQLEPDQSYVERRLCILDRKEKVLRNKAIPLVMCNYSLL
ncbi:uncharacterized protein [Henckelia pumila]|uniref:uncharacterized protein n=1 Tax=Henckelia pumila TaxID=405737 RepID=UPI003C6E53A4